MDRTIPQMLLDAAEASNRGLTFIHDDGTERTWSYQELRDSSHAVAHALQEEGLCPGDTAALILPDSEEFILTFFGALCAGVVPVPLYPPLGLGQIGGYLESSKHIVRASRARRVITTPMIRRLLGTVQEAAPECTAVLDVADLKGDRASFRAPDLTLDDHAFIQFTSGSTSRPKGVVLTHRNLAANSYAIMRDTLQSNDEDVGVSWLPLFHDMGLIGKVIAPLSALVPVVYMAPTQFLKRPRAWLEAISNHRGTISFSPNFGYGLCAKRVSPSDLEHLDLSAWRVAGCGAEPIQAETLEAFADCFAPVGFRQSAFLPCYGMAEHSLAISFAPLSRGVHADCVRSASLWEHGLAEPADTGEDGVIRVVSCGKPLPRHDVRVQDEEGRILSERQVGEIFVRGPSLMSGYFEAPEVTAQSMREGWFSTGDLGYFSEGEIFVCGRKKDIIIVNGRNYYPQDIEWAVGGLARVRTGGVVAFGAPAPDGSERVIVIVETREAPEAHTEIASAVRVKVHEVTGLHAGEVLLVRAGTIPKTTSGKPQRAKTRQAYLDGELGQKEKAGTLDVLKAVAKSQLTYLKLSLRKGDRSRVTPQDQ